MITVYRYRIKSKCGALDAAARDVNFVWNYCNDVQRHALTWGAKWPSRYDLMKLTAYSGLPLHSGTINAVCMQYASSRRQHRRPYLRYRGKRALGWVPFKGRDFKILGDTVRYHGRNYRVWLSRPIPDGAVIRDGGSFSQDSVGRWYVNIVLELPGSPLPHTGAAVGIDLGLKTLATLSDGTALPIQQEYRRAEERLAEAQRSGKRRLARSIHQKIKNKRRDYLHKASRKIVNGFDHIAIGNVSSSKLAKTTMAKSVLDAGWYDFKQMLRYKCDYAGRSYVEVDEFLTSQICSSCGSLPPERPIGTAGLSVREWICSECGTVHERDVNAARNILIKSLSASGEKRQPPFRGIVNPP